MKSFRLELGNGNRLTKTGVLLLAVTAAVILATAILLMRHVDHWTDLFAGLLVVAIGAAFFLGGCWLTERLGIPAVTGDVYPNGGSGGGIRRLLMVDTRSDWQQSQAINEALRSSEEIIESLAKIADALGMPSVRTTVQSGEYYVCCRNVDEIHFPESTIPTLTYDATDWKVAYLGPFESEAEARMIEEEIRKSLREETL